MAVSEEDIQYWVKLLPPPTPEQQQVVNYYRERWARLARAETADYPGQDISPAPRASAPREALGEATGPFKQ